MPGNTEPGLRSIRLSACIACSRQFRVDRYDRVLLFRLYGIRIFIRDKAESELPIQGDTGCIPVVHYPSDVVTSSLPCMLKRCTEKCGSHTLVPVRFEHLDIFQEPDCGFCQRADSHLAYVYHASAEERSCFARGRKEMIVASIPGIVQPPDCSWKEIRHQRPQRIARCRLSDLSGHRFAILRKSAARFAAYAAFALFGSSQGFQRLGVCQILGSA